MCLWKHLRVLVLRVSVCSTATRGSSSATGAAEPSLRRSVVAAVVLSSVLITRGCAHSWQNHLSLLGAAGLKTTPHWLLQAFGGFLASSRLSWVPGATMDSSVFVRATEALLPSQPAQFSELWIRRNCLHLLIGGGRFVKSIPGVCWWSWDHKVTGWAVQWDLLRSGSYPPCLGKVSQGRLSRTISSWVLSISSTSLGTFLQWWAAPCHRAASVSHSFTALPLAALQLSSDNSTEDNLSVHPVLFIFFLLVCVWSLCFFPTPFFCTARRVCRMALRQTSSPAF